MEQKNTIVKCNATTCLYNYNGICDQYVVDLDMYGQCKDYCECEKTEAPAQLKSNLEYDENDELVSVKMKVMSEGENKNKTILSFKNGSYIECLNTEKEPIRGKRAELPIIDDYAGWLDKRCRANCKHFSDRAGYPYCDFIQEYLTQLGNECEAYEEV